MATPMKLSRQLPLVVVLGATGAGKSKLALELATKFHGEIISADSMQVYKGLDIITNKVTKEERQLCPHHLIDYVSPLHQRYTVTEFRDDALKIIDGIHARQNVPIVVGGTNYYIEALLWESLINTRPSVAAQSESSSGTLNDPNRPGSPHGSSPDASPSGSPDAGTCLPSDERSKAEQASGESDVRVNPKWTTARIFEKLCEVDPETAKKYHPNDRRKLLRALEVYMSLGRTMSDVYKEQHSQQGAGPMSGPLRYPDPCILWVQCEQKVLDERTDKRVDEMMSEGLLNELLDFHHLYNQDRLKKGQTADYTLGIFQSIGFKEFHKYLILDPEKRADKEGQELLKQGIEQMKTVTRRYARKQVRWINNRFVRRVGPNVPPLYVMDSSVASEWPSKVHEPAVKVVSAYLQEKEIDLAPLKTEEKRLSIPEYNECKACNLISVRADEWQNHLRSNRHKKNLQHQRREHKRLSDILLCRERQLAKKMKEEEETD